MARLPQVNGDNDQWGSILNDFLSQSLNTDGTLKTTAVDTGLPASAVKSSRTPIAQTIPSNTYGPIVSREGPTSHPGSFLGLYAGAETIGGTDDPTIGLIYDEAGTFECILQMEGDGVYGAGQRQVDWYCGVTPDGGTTWRYPFTARYDRLRSLCTDVYFVIGAGQDAFGNVGGKGFRVSWDDGTNGGDGTMMFRLSNNRVEMYPSGAADENRLSLHSLTGKGSAVSWTWNSRDAEGVANPTLVMYSVSSSQLNMFCGGNFLGGFMAPTLTQAGLAFQTGIGLGDNTAIRLAQWASTGVPSNTLGNNNDWCLSDNGHIYFKATGTWGVKV